MVFYGYYNVLLTLILNIHRNYDYNDYPLAQDKIEIKEKILSKCYLVLETNQPQ